MTSTVPSTETAWGVVGKYMMSRGPEELVPVPRVGVWSVLHDRDVRNVPSIVKKLTLSN
jgi:hypothetical protein